jgi:hypothetical protein
MSTAEEYIDAYKELLVTKPDTQLAWLIEDQLTDMWEDMSAQDHVVVLNWIQEIAHFNVQHPA